MSRQRWYPDTGTIARAQGGSNIEAQEAQMLCEQAELSAATAARAAELQRQADLMAAQQQAEFQQRMQQTFAAAQAVTQPLVY